MTAGEQPDAEAHALSAAPMATAVPVFPDPVLVAKTMDHVFEKLKAKPVISRLKELGYSEVYAQKACLLYCARTGKPVLETSALLNWLNFEAKPQEVDRPITLQDLLEHLDIDGAVQRLLQTAPGLMTDTAKLAVTLCLGDVAAAEQLLATSSDAPVAPAGCAQLEKYLVAAKEQWVLSYPSLPFDPQPQQHQPQAPLLHHQQQDAIGRQPVDAAQMQAAAALMMSASSSSPALPSSPPAPPVTPTLTISSPSSATCSPSRSSRSTVYSGRKRSSSCNSSCNNCTSSSSGMSSYPGSPFSASSSSGGSTTTVFSSSSAVSLPSTSGSPFSTPSAGVAQGVTLAAQIGTSGEAGWELERRGLLAQVADLQRHKDWADSRIRDLIRKACEVEKPLAEENKALKEEAVKLEQERAGSNARVRQLEGNVARLKEGCFQEAANRREVERKMAEAKAEAQASLLREGELQAQLAEMQAQMKNLKRAVATADRQRQKLLEDKAEVDEQLAARNAQVSDLQQRLAAAEKLAHERAQQLEQDDKARADALAYAQLQAEEFQRQYRLCKEDAAQKATELQLTQARIETLEQEAVRQRAEVRSVQSELLHAQQRLKAAESRTESRLFMDGHWSAPDFLGQSRMLGSSWREGTRSPSSAGESSPDAGRVAELERKVAALKMELELERSRTRLRDVSDVGQDLNNSCLSLHSFPFVLEQPFKMPAVHPWAPTPC